MSLSHDFVITVATANGSGSQSSNNVLVRALFRLGLPVGGKNLFPSNIQGLPTWFTIRVNEKGFTARKRFADVVVAMNPQTAAEDLSLVRPGGFVFVSSEIKTPLPEQTDITVIKVPFKDLVAGSSDSVKLRKLLVNMAYVGVLAELLQIPEAVLTDVIHHQFNGKASAIAPNESAVTAGRAYAREHLKDLAFPFRAATQPGGNKDKILIDGNTASAMGLLFGGCTIVTWYPITPSSSVVESFNDLAERYRVRPDGRRDFAVLQAEDELAAISMVLGAGWAGARAMTATSGPGLSLMAEAAGLAYFAEIPSVIWDVQRVGPSTGLPTRTMQGDVLSAYYLSHGDTKHVVLLPGTPGECFADGQTAFDLAERLQTLVIVLSDLDIGMNVHAAHRFAYPARALDRGEVLDARALEAAGQFRRYHDSDGDGVAARTLPGTKHPLAAYFTRGTGHDESGLYSEKPDVYRATVDRLARKFETAKRLVPKPLVDVQPIIKIGLVTYGSSHEAAGEARFELQAHKVATNCLRLRALPFCSEFEEFLANHDRVYIIEQNRDAQLMAIIRNELPHLSARCHSVLNYDGLPLTAETIVTQILNHEGRTP